MVEQAIPSATARVTEGTSSTGDERLHDAPYQLRWSDYPADLVARWRVALKQIEGLCHALWTAPPDYLRTTGTPPSGWDRRHPRLREHPRCRWDTDQYEQRWTGAIGPTWEHYDWIPREYGALGDSHGAAAPHLPIRSRSGDPQLQYRLARHWPEFPVGSVLRTAFDDTSAADPDRAFDPRSDRFDPGVSGHPVWPDRATITHDEVTFEYTVPGAFALPDAVQLVCTLGTFTMARVGESRTYRYVLNAARPQGEEFHWYIGARWGESWKYDPLGPDKATAPVVQTPIPGSAYARSAGARYTFIWFTHHNPYRRGLPEMLDDWAIGTDRYHFDASESIQPALVNFLRYVIGRICDWASHNPRLMMLDPKTRALCCQWKPIRFRWSGGAPWPQYASGGKGGTSRVSPLHNLDADQGSTAARRTWRGNRRAYTGGCDYESFFDNVYEGAGGDESWEAYPRELLLEVDVDDPNERRVYYDGHERGLRPGDVVDPVHLLEIIEAARYLVRYGLWRTLPICSRPLTIYSFHGKPCHTVEGYYANGDPIPDYLAEWAVCDLCCDHYHDEAGNDTSECYPGYTCIAHPKPNWQECQDNCGSGRCYAFARWEALSGTFGYWYRERSCNIPQPEHDGCGTLARGQLCEEPEHPSGHSETVYGWSFWMCTPRHYIGGPQWPATGTPTWVDTNHGNGLLPWRTDHGWPLNDATLGPSFGNSYGDIYACTVKAPGMPDDPDIGFATVTPQIFEGMAARWYQEAEIASGPYDPVALDGDCEYQGPDYVHRYCYHFSTECDQPDMVYLHYLGCSCDLPDYPACMGTAAWVAVNLNLDGTGVVYAAHAALKDGGDEYIGDCIPTVLPFDFDAPSAAPLEQWSQCQCEKWTGPSACT